jgi:hypothetical protein
VLDHVGDGPLTLGCDLGTTTKKTSNPTAICLLEKVGMEFVVRLAARWKTDKGDITKAILVMLCAELVRRKKALRVVNIDSSNERFFAADCRTALHGLARVELSILGSKVEYRGEPMTLKARACGRVEAAAIDNRLRLPAAAWVSKDLRQMVKEAGAYNAEVEADGSHADFFIALALAMDAMDSSGPVEIAAVQVGGVSRAKRAPGESEAEFEDRQADEVTLSA